MVSDLYAQLYILLCIYAGLIYVGGVALKQKQIAARREFPNNSSTSATCATLFWLLCTTREQLHRHTALRIGCKVTLSKFMLIQRLVFGSIACCS